VRRARGGLGVGAGEFEEDAAAGPVVCRAVVDAVSFGVGIDAEVVVVGGVEDGVLRAG
jgi:hypothetical protein